MAPAWLGVGTVLEVALVEESDDGTPLPLGFSVAVEVVDVTYDLLCFVRQYDPVVDSDLAICPFHEDAPGCLPDVAALHLLVRS